MTTDKQALPRGAYGSSTYWSWRSMHKRCSNPNHPGFHRYGGRGITVCSRWISFDSFLEDMGERPSPEYTLDRIDGNKGYCPDNCRWATQKQQQRNRRNNRTLTFDGQTLCVSEWAERLGINENTLRRRLQLGWTVEDVLATPVPLKSNCHYVLRMAAARSALAGETP